MAEWLGNGLQNHVQQFDSAWHLIATISGCSETGTPADLFIGINECRLNRINGNRKLLQICSNFRF